MNPYSYLLRVFFHYFSTHRQSTVISAITCSARDALPCKKQKAILSVASEFQCQFGSINACCCCSFNVLI